MRLNFSKNQLEKRLLQEALKIEYSNEKIAVSAFLGGTGVSPGLAQAKGS